MKKLLAVSAVAALLAACSGPSNNGPQGQKNEKIDAALKACHESLGDKATQTQFDACMKEAGFEKPANAPQAPAAQ